MNEEKLSKLREKLRILERETGGVFENGAGCCGVTTAQCHTIMEIGKKDEITLIDLADALGLDASTMSRTIQGLVLVGLVDRKPGEEDRRFVKIRLTEQGRKVFDGIETLYNGYFDQVIEMLPEGRRENILAAVGEFADAVKRLNESTGCCRKGRRP